MESATAQLLSRQRPGQVLGVSVGDADTYVITSSDGLIAFQDQAQVDSQVLGSSSGKLVLPVQLAGSNYVGVAQLGRSTSLQVLSAPARQPRKRPLAECEHQLAVRAPVLGVHTLSAGSTGAAAVLVLADGTVGLVQSSDAGLQLQPTCSSTAAAADASSIRMAAQGSRLVVASQAAAGRVVALEVFSAAASSSKQPALEQTVSLQVPCPDAKAQLSVVSLYGSRAALTWSNSTATVLELPPLSTSQQQQEPFSSRAVDLHHHLPSRTAAAAASGQRGSRKGTTKAAAAATAGSSSSMVGLNTGQCLLLSDHHLLAWTLASDSSSSSSHVQFNYVLLDSQHGCQLGSGSLPLEVSSADVAAGAITCVPATPAGSSSSSGSAQLGLVAGGVVYVLHLPLPRADLAGLVGRLAVSYPSTTTTPAAAAAAGAPGLVQVEQVLHEGSLLQQGLVGVLAQGAGNVSSTCWLAPVDPAAAKEAVGVAGVRALEAAAQKAADALAAGGIGPQQKNKPLVAAVKGLVAELEAQQQQRQALNKQHQQQYKAAEQQRKEQATMQQQQEAAAGEASSKARKGRAATQQQQEEQENDPTLLTQQPQQQVGPLSHPSKVSLSEVLLGPLATALAEQQQHELLAQLLALQPLPTLLHAPALLGLLVAQHQYHLVGQVCNHARQVPAAALVGALQQLLSRATGTDAPAAQQQYWQALHTAAEGRIAELDAAAAAALEAQKPHVAADCLALAKHTAAAVEGFSPRQGCCHCLLAADFDAVELQAALKALGPQQLLRLMKYLSRWVDLYLSSGMYAEAKQAASSRVLLQPREAAVCKSNFDLVTPSWSRVLEWCQVVVDAHLTALALMPVAGSQLAELAAQLQQTATGTGQLLPLKGLLEHLSAGAPLPQAAVAANARYTVELLDLRVRPVQ